jgi:hypothetical protein
MVNYCAISTNGETNRHDYAVNMEINRIETLILDEISAYMNTKKPDHEIDPGILLKVCREYKIDPRLPLAQGWIESHWGTEGMAAKTKSVFNVGATGVPYDSISHTYKYATHNDCIEPYAKLIKERYLVNNKTEHDLMNHFVDMNGSRYAESEAYEYHLKIMWNKINKETNLEYLLTQHKKIIEEISYSKYHLFLKLNNG